MKLFLKTKLYAVACSRVGSAIFRATKSLITVDNLVTGKKTKPFLIAITVDTECGYVKLNEYRLWQFEDPHAFEGFFYGIRNLRIMAQKEKIPLTFLISGQALDAEGKEKKLIDSELKRIAPSHEIGYHLHPTIDFPLQRKLKRKLKHNSAKFYTHKEKVEMLKAGKEMIEMATGKKALSFRWGNWGMDDDFGALAEAGIKIDTSACPGAFGHMKDDRCFDWRKCKTQLPFKREGVLEVPIATFSYMGQTLLADPVYCDLLLYTFDYYYKHAARDRMPFVFTVITHSPEATYKNGRETPVLTTLRKFIRHAKKKRDVRFVRLRDAL